MLKLFILLFILISSSYASLLHRFSNDVENVQRISGENIWVVLVAGSNGYYNYRHQADVLHAYQLVKNVHKIPKERIILMMYDDIAFNEENPFKGNVINVPNGENLYTDDLEKDYVGDDVTPENFISILTKDNKLIDKKKKILNSTSENFVFIYCTDHGAPSLVAFPNGILSATKFHKALNQMHETNSYNKMVIYIEACESGSMFEKDLNPKKNVYAITAATAVEPSYACFWDDERKTYLADEFSVNWILDSYASDFRNQNETLFTQYLHVKEKTNDSHVSEFGDLEMGRIDTIDEFQGKKDQSSNIEVKLPSWTKDQMKAIRSDEVEYCLTKIHSNLNKDDTFSRLVQARQKINRFVHNLRTDFASKLKVDRKVLIGRSIVDNRDCYDEIINHLHETCTPLHLHTYMYGHLYLFVNTCNVIKRQNSILKAKDFNEIITQHCRSLEDFIKLTKVV